MSEKDRAVPAGALQSVVAANARATVEAAWLVKDFNALYRAAKRFSDACSGAGEDQGRPFDAHQALKAQLERLAPAFETTERERAGGL